MQNSELSKVIDTIRHLTRLTVSRGCTESEALNAAEKIGKLLKVYNLSMDKVFLGEAKCVTGGVTTGRLRRHPIDSCLVAIAAFCDCKVWFHRNWSGGESEYKFFGLETDVEMAIYLYKMILTAIDNAAAEFKASDTYRYATTHRKRLTVSFQRGMASRISNRLTIMAQEREVEQSREEVIIPDENGSVGTSLILVKRDKVQDEFEQLNLGLRKAAKHYTRIHGGAWSQGKEAGDRVSLNRPINVQIAGLLK
jgi:hypothetical protein